MPQNEEFSGPPEFFIKQTAVVFSYGSTFALKNKIKAMYTSAALNTMRLLFPTEFQMVFLHCCTDQQEGKDLFITLFVCPCQTPIHTCAVCHLLMCNSCLKCTHLSVITASICKSHGRWFEGMDTRQEYFLRSYRIQMDCG